MRCINFEHENNTFTATTIKITRENFYDQLSDKYNVTYYPYYKNFFKLFKSFNSQIFENLIETFKQKQKNPHLKIDKQSNDIIN